MRFSDLVQMSISNLLKRKIRTLLTVLGVVIGTTSIVVMLSLGIGLKQGMLDQIQEYASLTRVEVNAKSNYDENNKKLPKPPFRPQSGDLIQVKIKTPDSLPKDEKSGAVIIEL